MATRSTVALTALLLFSQSAKADLKLFYYPYDDGRPAGLEIRITGAEAETLRKALDAPSQWAASLGLPEKDMPLLVARAVSPGDGLLQLPATAPFLTDNFMGAPRIFVGCTAKTKSCTAWLWTAQDDAKKLPEKPAPLTLEKNSNERTIIARGVDPADSDTLYSRLKLEAEKQGVVENPAELKKLELGKNGLFSLRCVTMTGKEAGGLCEFRARLSEASAVDRKDAEFPLAMDAYREQSEELARIAARKKWLVDSLAPKSKVSAVHRNLPTGEPKRSLAKKGVELDTKSIAKQVLRDAEDLAKGHGEDALKKGAVSVMVDPMTVPSDVARYIGISPLGRRPDATGKTAVPTAATDTAQVTFAQAFADCAKRKGRLPRSEEWLDWTGKGHVEGFTFSAEAKNGRYWTSDLIDETAAKKLVFEGSGWRPDTAAVQLDECYKSYAALEVAELTTPGIAVVDGTGKKVDLPIYVSKRDRQQQQQWGTFPHEVAKANAICLVPKSDDKGVAERHLIACVKHRRESVLLGQYVWWKVYDTVAFRVSETAGEKLDAGCWYVTKDDAPVASLSPRGGTFHAQVPTK